MSLFRKGRLYFFSATGCLVYCFCALHYSSEPAVSVESLTTVSGVSRTRIEKHLIGRMVRQSQVEGFLQLVTFAGILAAFALYDFRSSQQGSSLISPEALEKYRRFRGYIKDNKSESN
ncbi:hypothetical protein M514_05018 [Trichuris suis]|uniref:Uncharacterized protein n=1 Tax=Trichuris suis TaxID=68888 RepID=A0A085M9V3_9BILA|nr:hypothetical protein M513_05018 [Trichuris suis]KFD67326.1 hypothetical protein M514_05018 [Trichuris suis]